MQVETLVNVAVASCILHNICELQNNVFLKEWQPDVIPLGQPPAVAIVDTAARTDATDVRDALAQYFALEVPRAPQQGPRSLSLSGRDALGRQRWGKLGRVGEGASQVKFGF